MHEVSVVEIMWVELWLYIINRYRLISDAAFTNGNILPVNHIDTILIRKNPFIHVKRLASPDMQTYEFILTESGAWTRVHGVCWGGLWGFTRQLHSACYTFYQWVWWYFEGKNRIKEMVDSSGSAFGFYK